LQEQYYFKRPRAALLLAIWLFMALGALLVAVEPGFICDRVAQASQSKIKNCTSPNEWWQRALLLVGFLGAAFLSISRVIVLRQKTPALWLDNNTISGLSQFGCTWSVPWTALTKIRQLPFSVLALETSSAVTPTRWMRLRKGRYTFAIIAADLNTTSDEIVRLIRTKRNDL
jgi:hypothetical protein